MVTHAGRAASELPPCCRACELYDAAPGERGGCRLLQHPTPENRHQLLMMPCRVQELIALRFRSHGPDIAHDALVSWLDPEWNPETLAASFGAAPRDARLWLTSWPYLYLGRNAVRRQYRDTREQPWSEPPDAPDSGRDDPSFPGRVLRALDGVRKLDAVGYAMVVELMRGELDAASWCASLGCSDATVTDRKYLAIYRYAVLFFDVMPLLEVRPRAALRARRFTAGDPNDGAALATLRSELRRPALGLAEFRDLYRRGAASSLEILSRGDALGLECMQRYDGTFRRVLRIQTDALPLREPGR